MPKVGEAFYELTARDQALLASLDRAEGEIKHAGAAAENAFSGKVSGAMDETGKAGTRLGGVFGRLHVDGSKLGGVMSNLGAGVLQGVGIAGFMGVTAAAGALVGGIGRAISAASDLNETVSKVGVVFGPAAKDIQEWGKTSADSLGMSENAALSAAGTFGNLFVALKLPSQQIPVMSKGLVGLAADLASFNNVDPTEALDALRSGLVGETEPLRRFGVNVNEATIAQKALELGLIKSTREAVTPAIKAQATYALILEQTKTAQGDFARTSDGLANQQRIAAAKVENAFSRLGQALLPIAAKVVPMLADAFSGLADWLGQALDWLGKLYDFLKPVIDVIFTLAGIVMNVLGGAFKFLGDTIGNIVNVVKPIFDTIVGTIKNIVNTVAGFLASFPNPLQDWAKSVQASMSEVQVSAGKMADDTVQTVADTTAAAGPVITDATTTGIADPMVDAMAAGRKAAVQQARLTPGEIADSLEGGKFVVQDGIDVLKDVMKNTMTAAKEEVKLQAFLSSKLLAQALNDSRPEVRAAAEAQKDAAEERLFALQHDVPGIALKTGQSYAAALAATHDKVNAAAATALAEARGRLTAMQADASRWGSATGTAYARGIASGISTSTWLISQKIATISRMLIAGSPPKYPDSPLYGIDRWGMKTGEAWGEGFLDAGPGIASKVKAVLGLAARAVMGADLGPAGLGIAPGLVANSGLSQAATVRTSFGALGALAGGSGASSVSVGDVHVHVDVDELHAADRSQISDLARQLASEVRLSLVRTPVTFAPGG